ncbi:hypothetical protein [Phormidium pseudopriestleyi]|uniref:hypothetical protein n=1 Tax=Phormidium pseudopriestleyi TaxID=1759527 RepID=UPI001A9003BB|nr:hypothetical protein [Phormidium pseudopriestleyi]
MSGNERPQKSGDRTPIPVGFLLPVALRKAQPDQSCLLLVSRVLETNPLRESHPHLHSP